MYYCMYLCIIHKDIQLKTMLLCRFDSSVLEEQYQRSSQATLTLRFQYALLYILVSNVVWAIYWTTSRTHHWPTCLVVALTFAAVAFFQLIYTRTKSYTVSFQTFIGIFQ